MSIWIDQHIKRKILYLRYISVWITIIWEAHRHIYMYTHTHTHTHIFIYLTDIYLAWKMNCYAQTQIYINKLYIHKYILYDS